MRAVQFSSLESLEPWSESWNRLAGQIPFRAWEWSAAWWKCYGENQYRRTLNVTVVFSETGEMIGVAPWYCEQSRRVGRCLRFLGTGEICSDYLGILATPGCENDVALALADELSRRNQTDSNENTENQTTTWDRLDVSGVDGQDRTTKRLLELLAQREHLIHSRPAPRCWRVALPNNWEDYETLLSHSHRKQVRRLIRDYFVTGRAILHTATTTQELEQGELILFDLHQRRQKRLGNSGCFASEPFRKFHQAVMPWLLQTGQLRLHWLEVDGHPIAAEYHLMNGGIVYAYQSGIDPDALEHEPGRLAAIATLQAAINGQCHGYDFLRGDEPYKAHWRAEPRRLLEVQVIPPHATARLRHGLATAGRTMKHWLKEWVG